MSLSNAFYLEVAKGNVTGYTAKEIIGLNGAVAETEDVWNQGGSITQVATAAVLYISSTNVLDVTQYVTVTGLDDNYDEITEVIGPLTGKVRVAGTVPFLRVNSATMSTTLGNAGVTTAALLYASSSDAADVGQIVTVTGLNADSEVITETFTLNGQTKITGTKYFLSVISATISAAAAGTVYVYFTSAIVTGIPSVTTTIQALIPMALAGKVYVFYAVAVDAGGVPTNLAKVQAAIDIATLQAYNAIYTVPRNKNLYMTSLRYRSTAAAGAFDVILSVIRKVYGGSNETIKILKYVDQATTKYTDGQMIFTDQPVIFPAKSEMRITANLAGGTALNLTIESNFVEEVITAVPNTVSVMTKVEYLAYLAASGPATLATQNYWLIGLDSLPSVAPTTVNLDDVLTTITGAALIYTVAADTEVAFDISYFTSGKLVLTDKKAVVTILRCVDSTAAVKYVLAPVNTLFSLGNVKKVSYLKV